MSGNTGSTNNAARDLSHLEARYRDLYKEVVGLRAERDRQAAEIGRLQSQISDMRRSLPMMMQSRNGNRGRGPPGMGGSKSRKNRKTRKQRKN